MEELLKETCLLTRLCEEGVFNTSSTCDVHTQGLHAVMAFVEHAVGVFSQKRYVLSDIMLQSQNENNQISEHNFISMKQDLNFDKELLSQINYDENRWPDDVQGLKKKIHQYLEESRKSLKDYISNLKVAMKQNFPSMEDSLSYNHEDFEKATNDLSEKKLQESQKDLSLAQTIGVQTEDEIYNNVLVKQETDTPVLEPHEEYLEITVTENIEESGGVEEKNPRKKRKVATKVKIPAKRKIKQENGDEIVENKTRKKKKVSSKVKLQVNRKIRKPRKCKERQKRVKLIDVQDEGSDKEEETNSPSKEEESVKSDKEKKKRKRFIDPLMVPIEQCSEIEKQVQEIIDFKASKSIPKIKRKKDLLMTYMYLKCCICNSEETFSQVSALTRHQFNQHAMPNIPEIKDTYQECTHVGHVKCKHCSLKFEFPKSSYSYDQAMLRVATQYISHVTSKHGDPMPPWIRQRVCPEQGCHFIGITIKSNYQHVRGHEKGYMTCEYCGRSLKKLCMNKHYTTCKTLVSKSARLNHTCNECGKKFMSEIGFQRHIQNIHQQEKNHLCFICSEMFFAKTTLYQHVFRAHNINISGKALKKCKHCDFTALPTMMAMHVNNAHPSKGLYTCEKCGKLFDQESYLRIHQRIHVTEKKYKCEHCSYAASRPDYLRAHVSAQHIDPEKFKCPWCEYTCGHRGNMAKHRKICRLRPPGVSPYLSGSKPAYIRPPNEHTLKTNSDTNETTTAVQNIDGTGANNDIVSASVNLSTTEHLMPIQEFQQENGNAPLIHADMMSQHNIC